MTSLGAIATYLPSTRVSVTDLADRFGLTPMQVKVFRRYHRIEESRQDPGGSLTDLLRAAVGGLTMTPETAARVRYVVYARTFPVVVPYPVNPLHEVCAATGLGHAQAFTVTHHACASGLLAIDLAGRLLEADAATGDTGVLALVLTGEKTFTGEALLVPETSVFGEGSAACLISADGDADRLMSYTASLHGEFDGDMEDVAGAFQRAYPDLLADAILDAVAEAGLTIADIATILPHNVNNVAWKHVCRRLGFPVDRVVLDNIPAYGHVFCADAFINHQTAVGQGRLNRGDRYVMAAAGAGRGATFSAMVFEH